MTLQPPSPAQTASQLCPAFPDDAWSEIGCLLAENPTEASLVGILLVLASGALALFILRRRKAASDDDDAVIPMVVRGTGSVPAAGAAPPHRRADRVRREPGPEAWPTTSAGAPAPAETGSAPAPAGSGNPAPDPGAHRMALSPEMRAGNGTSAGQADRDGGFPEGTLQLLPGRLVVESGEDEGREIRLARIPGRRAEITFGRSPGQAHEHVQLRSRTVSRLHARLIHEEGRWLLRNESTTNPTVLNGTSMGEAETEVLSDGDRVEMGEVLFRFRHPPPDNRLPSRSSWYTDGGRRPSNQDAVAVRTLRDGRELAVVCDGMGAHAAGGLASHRALESLLETLEKGSTLESAVRVADKEVRSSARQDPEHQGMGTTLVAMLRDGDSYRIANVGDSRAYRIDRNGIRQVTEDHSFVAEAIRDGSMSPEEAGRSPWRNAVTRHLGADEAVEVDAFGPFPATEPHLVILTSDGAHSVLAADRLHELAQDAPSVRDVARDIGEAALREGSDDNVTVAAVQLGAGSWHGVRAGRGTPRQGEQIAQETQPAD